MPTVPPGGVIPTLPGGVTPPIGTLPPTGLMPDRPEGGLLPDVLLPGGGGSYPPGGGPGVAHRVGDIVATEQALIPKHGWNVWMDATYLDISDTKSSAGAKGTTRMLTFGADTILRPGLILGFTSGWQDAHTTLYEGAMRIESDGYNLGPYLAWQCSERWMIDGALTYSQLDNTQRVLVLNGAYESQTFTASLGASGNYRWGRTMIRPRLAVNYGTNWADAYNLTGTLLGTPLDLFQPDDEYDTGTVTSSVEFSRVYFFNDRTPVMPYLNLEANYAFQHLGKGDTLTGDLSEVRTSSWSGAARVGMRILLSPVTNLTLSGGYTSIGQDGMDISEWRLYLSHAF